MNESVRREVTRIRFHENPDTGGDWIVTRGDSRVPRRRVGLTKKQLISAEAAVARERWKLDGVPTQLIVHTRDGGFEFTRTYGRDPDCACDEAYAPGFPELVESGAPRGDGALQERGF